MIIDSPIISGSSAASGSLNQFGNVTITGSVNVSGSFTSTGTLTAQTLVVQTITSSVVYSSGSNIFGNDLANTQVLTGSVSITGSLAVNGSNAVLSNQTSSMSASYALNATSASYAANATTASYALVAAAGGFPYTGSAQITGSLGVTGSVSATSFTGSLLGTSSYAVYSLTSSYSLAGSGFPFSGSAVITGSLLVTNLSSSGVSYLVADAAGFVTAQTASAAIKSTQAVTSTAGQTSFNITNGYTTGLVDVYINGTKLSAVEYTDTSGTVITLATGSNSGDTVEFVKYFPASGVTNNALRQQTTITASAGQTVFSASYTPGLLDIYYNGSRLSTSDFTANSGTYFTLATASAASDILDVLVYSYQVGAFSGIGGVGTADQIAFFGTTNSITGSPNFTISGSTMTVTGSLIVSGSGTFTNIGPAVFSGSLTSTAGFTGSFSGTATSASYAANAELLDGLDSTVFTLTSSFAAQTASFTAFTSSINSFTSSQNITNGTFTLTSSFAAQTASFTAFTASILAQTSSLNSFSASVLTFTGSATTRLGALEAATSSLYSYTSSLNNKTASFATTGSNTFIGTQTISGSVLQSGSFTTTGTLTAQTLVVQTITSSVDFVTGSTRFGSILGNTHTFTGSVNITGSLAVRAANSSFGIGYYNADGTLTGGFYNTSTGHGQFYLYNSSSVQTLQIDGSGGSAIFASTVTNVSALYVRASNNSDLPFINFSNADGVYNWGRVGGLLQGDGDGSLYFQTKTGGGLTTKLTITSTGAATFSSTISATSATFSGGATFFNGGNTFVFAQNVLTSGNADGAHIRNVISTAANPTYAYSGDNDTGMYSDAANTLGFTTGGTNRLTIASTGAATFSSTVTATGAIRSINSGVDASYQDAFVGVYSANNNEQNAIQASVSSTAQNSGFRFQASNGGGSASRTTVADFLRDRQIFYHNVLPASNGTQDLGSSSLRWSTVYTSDLDMSNGIGDYTIVEGEEDLFLYNNKTNKVFKFVIQEVDPSIATPKMKK